MSTRRYLEGWQDGIEILIAVWLIFSPFLLAFVSYSHDVSNATLTSVLVGTAVFAMSQYGAAKQKPWVEWLNLVLAVILVASPFVLGYAGSVIATWNAIISGVLLGALAIASMSHEYVQSKMHHPTMG